MTTRLSSGNLDAPSIHDRHRTFLLTLLPHCRTLAESSPLRLYCCTFKISRCRNALSCAAATSRVRCRPAEAAAAAPARSRLHPLPPFRSLGRPSQPPPSVLPSNPSTARSFVCQLSARPSLDRPPIDRPSVPRPSVCLSTVFSPFLSVCQP